MAEIGPDYILSGTRRTLDVCVASGILALSSPISIIAAVGTAAYFGPRNLLFRQHRFRPNNPGLFITKFRTTAPEHELSQNAIEINTSPKFSNLLRRTGIDELPQLLSVISGSMTMHGIRPLLKSDHELRVNAMHDADQKLGEDWQLYYDMLPPAISGPGSLLYHTIDMAEVPPPEVLRQVMRADVGYVESACLQTDMRLLSALPSQIGHTILNFLHK